MEGEDMLLSETEAGPTITSEIELEVEPEPDSISLEDIGSSDMLLPASPRFYRSYLDIASVDVPPEIEPAALQLLKDRGFTRFLIENEDPVTAVKMLAFTMSHSLLKPQRLLVDTEDYYVAVDLFTNTYYICYRQVLMVDVDRYKQGQDLEDLKTKLAKHPELFFRIYASRNGYHVFVLNRKIDYKSDTAIRLMHELGCDFYYMVYSYLRGWSVRLNKKKGEEDTPTLYTWVGDVVCGQYFAAPPQDTTTLPSSEIEPHPTSSLSVPPTDQELDSKLSSSQPSSPFSFTLEDIMPDPTIDALVDLHLNLTEVFAEVGVSSMPAP